MMIKMKKIIMTMIEKKETLKIKKKMEKGLFIGLMVIDMKEILKMMKEKEKVKCI